jgi:hypothetical protein
LMKAAHKRHDDRYDEEYKKKYAERTNYDIPQDYFTFTAKRIFHFPTS